MRRLSNIHRHAPTRVREEVIEHFTQQMVNSGYGWRQTRDIVMSGIQGWRRKLERRKKEGFSFYREAKKTLGARFKKKLLGKTNWYKKRKGEEEEEGLGGSKRFKNGYSQSGRRNRKLEEKVANPEGNVRQGRQEPVAVMFVPYTICSGLAKELREAEEMLYKLTGYRLKIVERSGTTLEMLLHKSDPWQGIDCEREGCLLCETKQKTGKNLGQDCHKRSIVYLSYCMDCEEGQNKDIEDRCGEDKEKLEEERKKTRRHIYIGETARSCFERLKEHQSDMRQLKVNSHMLRHIVEKHEGQNYEEVTFGVRIVRTARTSFERQITESQ